MKMILHTYDLKMKHTFKIAHDQRDIQKTLVLELTNGSITGYGEATANNYYGYSVNEMIEVLEANRQKIEMYDGRNPEEFWRQMRPLLSPNSFAQCALDVAANDLYGKLIGKSLYQIWGTDLANIPTTSYTIGIDSIQKMVEKMQEFPWPMYKIKLGTKEDLEIIEELRKHTDAPFRVDANCAWEVNETINNSRVLKKLNVEFIEQPLQADNWEGMKEVFAKSELPLIADESCVTEEYVVKCHNHFHGVNIKLMKCGGLTPARQMIKKAKSLRMKVMVGCMTESSVGIAAIAQLLPSLDYVDVDGAVLITNDIAEGLKLRDGQLIMPVGHGTGVTFLG